MYKRMSLYGGVVTRFAGAVKLARRMTGTRLDASRSQCDCARPWLYSCLLLPVPR
jgi:hypothetical protein